MFVSCLREETVPGQDGQAKMAMGENEQGRSCPKVKLTKNHLTYLQNVPRVDFQVAKENKNLSCEKM